MSTGPTERSQSEAFWIACFVLGIGLTMWFWLDLWLGGGLIGGDVYTYYFPQKSFLADTLKAGQQPWWNSLVGHGYPFVAESQAGVYYPPTRVLYWLFDLNTAYNINHLAHYLFAFVATMLLARELKLSLTGSLLASLVFVYGWFPARCCLEWAILTGAYLPWNLWLLLRAQRRADRWSGWLIAPSLALQLLAGHFHLAFITLLVMAGWMLLTLLWRGPVDQQESSPEPPTKARLIQAGWLGGVIAIGFLMAGIQLVPTWELKQQSQRETSHSDDFNPAYGHLPPRYVSQLAIPWLWYTSAGKLADRLSQPSFLAIDADTNPIEAHMYFGFLPLLLILYAAVPICRGRTEVDHSLRILAIPGLFGLLYAFGWLLPMLGEFPGFSFFRGPGRYTLMTTLAAACWAGRGWDLFQTTLSARKKQTLFLLLFAITVIDFSWVSKRITYAIMIPETPITQREKSEVARLLKRDSTPARLYAPGQNLVTITGVAATPVYLGIGPAEYFDPALTYPPDEVEAPFGSSFTDAQIDWLQRAGVTHILGFAPPPAERPEVELVWQGMDRFLNRAWGRPEPLYLSRLHGSRGRAAWLEGSEDRTADISWEEYSPTRVALNVTTEHPNTLVLTDLFHDNWQVYIDAQPGEGLRIDGMFRGAKIPPGSHHVEWRYKSIGISIGFWLSVAAFTIWLIGLGLTVGLHKFSINYLQKGT